MAVLGGKADLGAEVAAGAAEELQAARVLLVAEAEQDAQGDPSFAEAAAQ